MTSTVTLPCEAGHDWERPAQRGRKPRWCPEHRPVTVTASKSESAAVMVTLHCEAGHDWERPAQRGRKPRWCPEHRPQAAETETQTAPKAVSGSAARTRFIALCKESLESMVDENAIGVVNGLLSQAEKSTATYGTELDDKWYAYHTDTVKTWARQGQKKCSH